MKKLSANLYQEYNRRLDGREILRYYCAENVTEEVGPDETTELRHSCLLDRNDPHHSNGDSSPSASLNPDKRLYICYSLGWGGDLFRFIMKMEKKETFAEILPLLGQFLGDVVRPVDDFKTEIQKIFSVVQKDGYGPDLSAYSDRVLAPWAYIHPYLTERGIDHETASKFQIGWDENENRITIPVFFNNRLVGWQKRTIPDRPGQWSGTADQIPKYRSSLGFLKSSVLYGYDLVRTSSPTIARSIPKPDTSVSRSIIVVESPFSVIKAQALGVENVVATFGSSVSSHQIDLLKEFDQVAVWFDDDAAGRVGERKLVRELYRHTNVRVVSPDRGLDLADCDTAESVMAKIAAAKPAALKIAEWERENGSQKDHRTYAQNRRKGSPPSTDYGVPRRSSGSGPP